MIFILDKHKGGSVIDYCSIKSRRFVRPVLGIETSRLADPCDSTIFIQHDETQILHKRLRIKILTDIEAMSNIITRNAKTNERRLMIYVKAVRIVYNEKILDDVVWI